MRRAAPRLLARVVCFWVPLAWVSAGCDPAAPSVDGGASFDAGRALDAAGPVDGGAAPLDAFVPSEDGGDAGSAVVGTVSGPCGSLDDAQWLSSSPYFLRNSIDFPNGLSAVDEALLSEGAREILLEGTAGGSSGMSEAISFEILHRCEGAVLVKTETEVLYDPVGSDKTDILVEIDGHRIGVSVTRAVAFPFDSPYPVDRAQMLLERKLTSILESSMNVVATDAWVKQILHVIAYAPMHADSIRAAWDLIDPAIRADTILLVTVTDGDDAFIY
jgi:hypothetical protein